MAELTILGWDFNQWARVLALFPDHPVGSLADAVAVRREYLKRYRYEPPSRPVLVGATPDLDYAGACAVFAADWR